MKRLWTLRDIIRAQRKLSSLSNLQLEYMLEMLDCTGKSRVIIVRAENEEFNRLKCPYTQELEKHGNMLITQYTMSYVYIH